jgi:hypothetical protein
VMRPIPEVPAPIPSLRAQVLVNRWRRHYNAVRPHSALGYRPLAPEAVLPWTESMALSHQMVPIRVT